MCRVGATVFTLLCSYAATTPAQQATPADSVARLIERAIAHPSDVAFDAAIAQIDRVLAMGPDDVVLRHHRGHALFRKASVIATDRTRRDEARALLRLADRELEASEPLRWPETPALRASVAGQLIGLSNPVGAIAHMTRANRQLQAALKLGPDNPRVWLMHGIATYFKPGLVGGGQEAAARDLRRAIALFDQSADAPGRRPTWGRAEAHAWLGRTLAAVRNDSGARAEYDRALALDPGFAWVRDMLIPELDAQVAATRLERERHRARSSAVINPDMSRRR